MNLLTFKYAIDLVPGDQVIVLDPIDEEGDIFTISNTEIRQKSGEPKMLLLTLEAGIFDYRALLAELEFETPILVLGKQLEHDT